jgi:hypothetical protein
MFSPPLAPLEEGGRAASPSMRGIEGEHNYHDFLSGYHKFNTKTYWSIRLAGLAR